MKFYTGVHHPADARLFDRAFISVNVLRGRKSDIPANGWIMDSGAFTEISTNGRYRKDVDEYVEQIGRWSRCGDFHGAVSQDWMCEPFIVEKTGLSVEEHQAMTIDRYQKIKHRTEVNVIPVLQGYHPEEYASHVDQYGRMLKYRQHVGVGSICRRNTSVQQIEAILVAISRKRPDLRLHGFGIKTTALASQLVWNLLFSADSMAWSFAARMEGRNSNDPMEGVAFSEKIMIQPRQQILNLPTEFWS